MTKDMVTCAMIALSLAVFLALPMTGFAQDIEFISGLDEASTACDYLDDDCCCRRGGFWFAGAEATMLQTVVRSGGVITASFSDTTAPGVSTAAFVDGDGLDEFAFGPRVWVGRQFNEKWALPAYLRRGVKMNDVPHSSEPFISKYNLNDDNSILGNNKFLHDNVD